MSRAFAASRGWGGSVRVPRPHLFAPLLAAAVPALQHQSPTAQPAGATAGDARTRARARSREGSPIHVKFGGGAHPRTKLGVGSGRAEGVVSAPSHAPRRGVILSPTLPRGPRGFQRFTYYSAFRVRASTRADCPGADRWGCSPPMAAEARVLANAVHTGLMSG